STAPADRAPANATPAAAAPVATPGTAPATQPEDQPKTPPKTQLAARQPVAGSGTAGPQAPRTGTRPPAGPPSAKPSADEAGPEKAATGKATSGKAAMGKAATVNAGTPGTGTAGGPEAATRPAGRPLRGVAARIAENMDESLSVPTATSVRAVPAKLLEDNRIVINNSLARGRGGKVSFTHLIGYAVVRAIAARPAMNRAYARLDGRPAMVDPEHVNLGLAIDLPRPDGSRTLVVPNIKAAE